MAVLLVEPGKASPTSPRLLFGDGWRSWFRPSACSSATPCTAPVLIELSNEPVLMRLWSMCQTYSPGDLAREYAGFICAVSLSTAARFSRMKYSPLVCVGRTHTVSEVATGFMVTVPVTSSVSTLTQPSSSMDHPSIREGL